MSCASIKLGAAVLVVLLILSQHVYGAVKSVEDHGYVISFGVKEFSGFLLKKNTQEHEDGRRILSLSLHLVPIAILICILIPLRRVLSQHPPRITETKTLVIEFVIR